MRALQILFLLALAVFTVAWEEAVFDHGEEQEDAVECLTEHDHCLKDSDCCEGLGCEQGRCKDMSAVELDRLLTGTTYIPSCAADSAQCGGKNWSGPTRCCSKGSKCYYRNEYFSKCSPAGSLDPTPACKKLNQQCGGSNYKGTKTCCSGLVCKKKSATYSSCKKASCVADNGQCGGKNWKGDTKCCGANSVCTVKNEWYSKCAPKSGPSPTPKPTTKPAPKPTNKPTTPAPDANCQKKGQQCGGKTWEGSTCCKTGLTCVYTTKYYSQCREQTDCADEWEQCGGANWKGSTCCINGWTCNYVDSNYSQCKPTPPPTNAPTAKPTTAATAQPTSAATAKPTTAATATPTAGATAASTTAKPTA